MNPSLRKRFWAKVKKTRTCWIWTAARNGSGYGVIGVGSKNEMAHRLAWKLSGRKIEKGLKILHKCDNPPCVRLSHLFKGTQADNIHDMFSKGRSWNQTEDFRRRMPGILKILQSSPRTYHIGSKHHLAKLKESKVLEIRRLRISGLCYREIAKRFNVGKSTVARIVSRAPKGGWRHV